MDSQKIAQVVHMDITDIQEHVELDLMRCFHVAEVGMDKRQLAIEDADGCSCAPTTPSVSGETEVPECPPDSDDEGLEDLAGDPVPGMVTRQLPRTEVLSRQDALDAIRKEFDGISQMGTWDLSSVAEEEVIRAKAIIEEGETIHLADLLAICSEKHVELEPKYRSLKGRVCYRGDAARTAKGEVAFYLKDPNLSFGHRCEKQHV